MGVYNYIYIIYIYIYIYGGLGGYGDLRCIETWVDMEACGY